MRKIITVACIAVSIVSAANALADDEKEGKDGSKGESAKASASASAGPGTQKPISAALLLGYGFEDGYNVGIGLRGGYTLANKVYVGGTVIYQLGHSEDIPNVDKASQHIWLIGAEGGYTFDFGVVIARPYLGLGLAVIRGERQTLTATGGGATVPLNFTPIYVAPGVTGLYPIGSAFIGLDMRFVINVDNSAFATFLTGGKTF